MFTIRQATLADKAFILSTWIKGAYYGHPWMQSIDSEAYYRFYPPVLERLLQKPSVNVLIACLSDEPDVVLGYLAYEPACSLGHFAFVKRAWRSKGILRTLLAEAGPITQVSHLTKPGNAIRIKKGYKFNPFTL